MNNAGIWQENSPYSKLLITVGIVFFSVVLFTTIALVLAMLSLNVGYGELQSILNDPENSRYLSLLKFVQTLSTIGMFVVPPLILAHLFSRHWPAYLFLNKKISLADVLLVLVVMFAAVPLINYLAELNEKMSLPPALGWLEKWMQEKESAATDVTKKFLEVNTASGLMFNIFMIAFLPAVGEELFFRGILQRIFTDWTKKVFLGIIISAALFSALHMQFYGFLPRFLLGILLSYLLVWSGSLWLPVTAHFINNASAVIMLYLFRSGSIGLDPDKVGAESDTYSALVTGTLFMIAALWLLYRKLRLQRQNEDDEMQKQGEGEI